ncbi:MAG: patatin-like phospholipase family protein [Archangium sp.]|nr:patatin-like phospholipase family protein [Archangium sp.]
MSSVPWFDSLDAPVQAWLLEHMGSVQLEAGQTLFHAGAPADCLYLVTRGALGAFAAGDESRLLGQVAAGETVGELALMTGQPRSATVKALRDSTLRQLSREGFTTLVRLFPDVLLALARLVVARAQQPMATQRPVHPRTLALLPQNEGLDAGAFAAQLEAALGGPGQATTVRRGDRLTPAAMDQLERERRFVLYVADADDGPWRRQCVGQADALVLVAEATSQPAAWSEVVKGVTAPLPRAEHLVLLHPQRVAPGTGTRWHALRSSAQLHHVVAQSDVARVARLMDGRATSLVLSGGGARGFAHLGALRALHEAGVPIDAVGGTSIGAIIGAGFAAGWSLAEMTEVYRDAFLSDDPLRDYTLPLVALSRGSIVTRLLRRAYGRLDFEDLLRPFFCVSTNLTQSSTAVHRRGRLWQSLRASAAIPGVLPPVLLAGEVFVDGGVRANLPVEEMRALHQGDVIAIDIGASDAVSSPVALREFELPPWWRVVWDFISGVRRPSVLEVTLSSGMVNASAAITQARAAASLLIAPDMRGIDLLDWHCFDEAISRGYEATKKALERDTSWPRG